MTNMNPPTLTAEAIYNLIYQHTICVDGWGRIINGSMVSGIDDAVDAILALARIDAQAAGGDPVAEGVAAQDWPY